MRQSSPTKLFGKKGGSLFMAGVDLFNTGKHWEAHEVFEDVWRLEKKDMKKLAQGFVQLAAGFSYIKKNRYKSILYLFEKSSDKLIAAAHLFPGANIPQLVEAMAAARQEVERLGIEELEKFPSSLYPRIRIESTSRSPKTKSTKRR